MKFEVEVKTKGQYDELAELCELDLLVGDGLRADYYTVTPFVSTEEEIKKCYEIDEIFMRSDAEYCDVPLKKIKKERYSIFSTTIFHTEFGDLWRQIFYDKKGRKSVSTLWEENIIK